MIILEKTEKKRLYIFLGIAFLLPYALGILMGYGFYKGVDVSAFPMAQMFYPAAGAMLAVLLTKKEDEQVPETVLYWFSWNDGNDDDAGSCHGIYFRYVGYGGNRNLLRSLFPGVVDNFTV